MTSRTVPPVIDPAHSPAQVVAILVNTLVEPERDLTVLRAVVTPQAAARWGDFEALAYNWSLFDRPGIATQERSEEDVFDVVYVPIVIGVQNSFIVTEGELQPVIGVFTLVFSRGAGRWLVHDFTEYSRRPDPRTVPRD